MATKKKASPTVWVVMIAQRKGHSPLTYVFKHHEDAAAWVADNVDWYDWTVEGYWDDHWENAFDALHSWADGWAQSGYGASRLREYSFDSIDGRVTVRKEKIL